MSILKYCIYVPLIGTDHPNNDRDDDDDDQNNDNDAETDADADALIIRLMPELHH